jgi:secondary thiamine-phosphate synthase enzyme
MKLTVQTTAKRDIVDITDQVAEVLKGDGVIHLFMQHTTAALTTADLDPDTDLDYLDALTAMTPTGKWHHPHNPEHFPDHLWATIIGPDVSVPFHDGRLSLGSWQRIIVVELDGPRSRQIELSILKLAN